MKRRKQKAETLCRGSSLFCVSCPSFILYRFSTSFRICSNSLRISLRNDVSVRRCILHKHLLRTIAPVGIDGVPYCLTPLHQLFDATLDVLGTSTTTIWIDFNGNFFRENLTNDLADACFQKTSSIESHCKFHCLRKGSVPSKQSAVC